jgi:hypothetical protein
VSDCEQSFHSMTETLTYISINIAKKIVAKLYQLFVTPIILQIYDYIFKTFIGNLLYVELKKQSKEFC